MKLSNGLIIKNLQLIDNCGNQGLNVKKFIDEKGLNSDPSNLVDYLLKYDLAEYGEVENHFYLTDKGYAALEQSAWFDPDISQKEAPIKERGLNYSSRSTRNPKKRKNPMPISGMQSAFIISALVAGFGYFFSDVRETKDPGIDFLLEGIEVTLDSIKNSKHNKPVIIIDSQD